MYLARLLINSRDLNHIQFRMAWQNHGRILDQNSLKATSFRKAFTNDSRISRDIPLFKRQHRGVCESAMKTKAVISCSEMFVVIILVFVAMYNNCHVTISNSGERTECYGIMSSISR